MIAYSVTLPMPFYQMNWDAITSQVDAWGSLGISLKGDTVAQVLFDDDTVITQQDVDNLILYHNPNEKTVEQDISDLKSSTGSRITDPKFIGFLTMDEVDVEAWVAGQVEIGLQTNYPGAYNVIQTMAQMLTIIKDELAADLVVKLRRGE